MWINHQQCFHLAVYLWILNPFSLDSPEYHRHLLLLSLGSLHFHRLLLNWSESIVNNTKRNTKSIHLILLSSFSSSLSGLIYSTYFLWSTFHPIECNSYHRFRWNPYFNFDPHQIPQMIVKSLIRLVFADICILHSIGVPFESLRFCS